MEQQKGSSAYRQFRACAYRNKYQPALTFGGRTMTYGDLLERIEQAYNTFRQMGVEQGECVCLWLPNCPDLLCAFYALLRLGATPILSHPKASPLEIHRQMDDAQVKRLMTTRERYDLYCRGFASLPAGRSILCRPERDLHGKALAAYRKNLKKQAGEEQEIYWDQQTAYNKYHSGEAAYQGEQAVLLYASSSFLGCRPVCYLAEELEQISGEFYRHRERAHRIYIETSFAFEGGFLATHSALCSGREVLWCEEEKAAFLKKYQPDLLIGTEELFWELRQRAAEFGGRWEGLQGGIQLGKDIAPLMAKYAPVAFKKMGGSGSLSGSPVPLKLRRENLFYLRDFGIRFADMEARLELLEEVEQCSCLISEGKLTLQIIAQGGGSKELGQRLAALCRGEMGMLHRPEKIEFKRF